jgi:hypothetical protein
MDEVQHDRCPLCRKEGTFVASNNTMSDICPICHDKPEDVTQVFIMDECKHLVCSYCVDTMRVAARASASSASSTRPMTVEEADDALALVEAEEEYQAEQLPPDDAPLPEAWVPAAYIGTVDEERDAWAPAFYDDKWTVVPYGAGYLEVSAAQLSHLPAMHLPGFGFRTAGYSKDLKKWEPAVYSKDLKTYRPMVYSEEWKEFVAVSHFGEQGVWQPLIRSVDQEAPPPTHWLNVVYSEDLHSWVGVDQVPGMKPPDAVFPAVFSTVFDEWVPAVYSRVLNQWVSATSAENLETCIPAIYSNIFMTWLPAGSSIYAFSLMTTEEWLRVVYSENWKEWVHGTDSEDQDQDQDQDQDTVSLQDQDQDEDTVPPLEYFQHPNPFVDLME